jgi:hypothetical protein
VIWPEKYDPKTSAVYALNDIDVKAPPSSGMEAAGRRRELVELLTNSTRPSPRLDEIEAAARDLLVRSPHSHSMVPGGFEVTS